MNNINPSSKTLISTWQTKFIDLTAASDFIEQITPKRKKNLGPCKTDLQPLSRGYLPANFLHRAFGWLACSYFLKLEKNQKKIENKKRKKQYKEPLGYLENKI